MTETTLQIQMTPLCRFDYKGLLQISIYFDSYEQGDEETAHQLNET